VEEGKKRGGTEFVQCVSKEKTGYRKGKNEKTCAKIYRGRKKSVQEGGGSDLNLME
jgi:hypothetical protein